MVIREIERDDLHGILELYTHLNANPMPIIDETTYAVWEEILEAKHQHVIVAIEDDVIVASCVITVIPTLTRQQRPYAVIENVVTNSLYEGKGYGRGVMEYAESIARQNDCHRIMLQTGAKEERIHRFYQNLGYTNKDKTAYIKWFI